MASTPVPTISPGEMQILVSRAGLVLNPGQVADLVLAWRQVAGLIAVLPHDRPLVDDLAYTFRLPPPTVAADAKPPARERVPAKPKRAARKAAPAKAKPRGSAKKASASSKPRATAKKARSGASRRR